MSRTRTFRNEHLRHYRFSFRSEYFDYFFCFVSQRQRRIRLMNMPRRITRGRQTRTRMQDGNCRNPYYSQFVTNVTLMPVVSKLRDGVKLFQQRPVRFVKAGGFEIALPYLRHVRNRIIYGCAISISRLHRRANMTVI